MSVNDLVRLHDDTLAIVVASLQAELYPHPFYHKVTSFRVEFILRRCSINDQEEGCHYQVEL